MIWGKEQDLPGLGKGDKGKVALARWLRQETTMKLKMESTAAADGQLDLCLQSVA